jgi:peptidoglycan/LPS O-acetylase OafA/YrhL
MRGILSTDIWQDSKAWYHGGFIQWRVFEGVNSMKYRADVDGLRAIAILFVLVFHGGLKPFTSGFIGVDVFFVISGFLITSIISHGICNNRFSFIEFYNRRLWRLQPVFVCLIFATLLVSAFFYLPSDYVDLGQSSRKTSLFISNLLFARITDGYAAPDVNQLPLLHTWSLSIEWQCYLILPVMLYLLYRYIPKTKIPYVITAATACFFALALHLTNLAPAKAYYQFAPRIFEFLLGALTAITNFEKMKLKKPITTSIGIVSLGALVYIACKPSILVGYPNWYALFISVSTACLIAIGNINKENLVSRLLATKPFVFIGLLSYSLYIWHWGLFSTLRYLDIKETPVILMQTYFFTFILGYLSWRFIERPARKLNTMAFQKTCIILLVLPITLVHINGYFIKKTNGYPGRLNSEVRQIYTKLDNYYSHNREICIDKNLVDFESQCQLGTKKPSAKRGFMFGDSFSNHYFRFIENLANDAKVNVIAQGTSSCLTLPDVYLYDWFRSKNTVYTKCHEQTTRYYDMVEKNHYDFVIIGQLWVNYYSPHVINKLNDERSVELSKLRIEKALDKALSIITKSGAKPIIINNTYSKKQDCFFKHIKYNKPYDPSSCNMPLKLSIEEQWFNRLFEKMKLKYPKLAIIDPKKFQCIDGICKADIEGVPVFRDTGHLTDYASYKYGKLFLKLEKNPLL